MKIVLKYRVALLLAFFSLSVHAQEASERGNLTNYYHQRLHFGFALGINRGNFLIQPTEHFERLDSLKTVTSAPKPGFSLGIVSELMLHKYVTLRFLPALSFTSRNLDFYFEGIRDTISKIKTIESVFLNFPVDVKLRSKRVGNFGAYILAGGGYCLDLASKRDVANDSPSLNDQIVKLKRDDLFYEAGAGAEFYLQYFKFAVEAKISLGAFNIIAKDNTIFSNSIDKLRSKIFMISITFEG